MANKGIEFNRQQHFFANLSRILDNLSAACLTLIVCYSFTFICSSKRASLVAQW